jgi:hypothetical protein
MLVNLSRISQIRELTECDLCAGQTSQKRIAGLDDPGNLG